MLNTTVEREDQATESTSPASRRMNVSYRQVLERLAKHVPFTEAWVVSTLPRGGLQVVQPGKVSETLLRTYGKDFHAEDRLTWKAVAENRLVTAEEAWEGGSQQGHARYVDEFMTPAGLRYVVAAPVAAPVLEGFDGALHVYRTSEQGAFSEEEKEAVADAAREMGDVAERTRASRLNGSHAVAPWTHQLPAGLIALDGKLHPRVGGRALDAMDERLREQLLSDARHRLQHSAGEAVTSDRLLLPAQSGELWTFRVVVYQDYPALGGGPWVIYSHQPDSRDWGVVRPVDFQADAELSRLVPALQFMQAEYHRGPTLNEIAKTVHLSPFHFHRRFTELLGITPKHFLLECQIHEAKTQLVSGEKDLVDIAASCGFAHQSHFTSRFKQATGLTPTRWRKMATSGPAAPNNDN